ncbi:MAG: hypothetical protein ACM3JI_04135 [Anaerolineae bacterium]
MGVALGRHSFFGPLLIIASVLLVCFKSLHSHDYSHVLLSEPLWCLGAFLSIGLGMLITFLSLQELKTLSSSYHQKISSLQKENENLKFLQQQLEITAMQKEQEVKKELMLAQNEAAESLSKLSFFKKTADEAERQGQKLKSAHDTLAEEILRYQKQVLSLEQALQEIQAEQLQKRTSTSAQELPVVQDHEKPSSSSVFEHLYTELKKQFKEKSEILTQSRKELFHLENKWLSQQLEIEEWNHRENGEERALMELAYEIAADHQILEAYVEDLEGFVRDLLTPKKRTRAKKPKIEVQELDLLI